MRSTLLVAMFVIAVSGCDKGKKLEWNAQATTTFQLGPYHFDIPPGWRDVAESKLPQLAHITASLGSDAHMMVRETDTNTDTNISFMWSEGSDRVTCAQFVDLMVGASGADGQKIDKNSIADETFGTDKGCSFRFSDHDQPGKMWTRVHGNMMLTLACLFRAGGDADGDATCTRMAAALRAQT